MNKYLDYTGLTTLVNKIKELIPTTFSGSGTNHSQGLVPDPGATQGDTKYLREDGTWAVPEGNTDLTDYVQKSEIYEEISGGYVDLDLPSGLLWATGNIVKDDNGDYSMGDETDYGCCFSWGNIEGHNADEGYNWGTTNLETYASTPGASVNTDISPTDADHDAALACLGNPWRLPTNENFKELYDNTDYEWTTIDDINGWKFMKKTDHSIYVFFPVTYFGYGTNVYDRGSSGYYWSSAWNSADNACIMYFDSSSVTPQYSSYRYVGLSVRAVANTTPPPTPKYAQKSELADVATSGSYNDLVDKPSNTAYLSNDTGEGIVPDDGIRTVTVTSAAAITVNPDVITVIDGAVGTAAITLQVPQDNLAHVWDIMMTTDSTVAITFAMSNSATILAPSGFSIGASKAVEISVIGVGTKYYLRYGEFA